MAGAIPDIIIRLVADVDDFIRDWDRAADAAERAAARIRAAGAAAGNGPDVDSSRFRDLNAELERMTRTARAAADAIRDHGNSSRRASEDVEELRRRLGELGGSLGQVGGAMRGMPTPILIAAFALLLSILPGVVAGIFALGGAITGIALAAGVAALGAKGLGQAFDGLQRTIAPLQRQLDSVFRAELSQEMIKLGQTITAELTPAFKGVAHAISDLIKDTTEWIRSSEGISTIKQAMGGVQDLVRELSPAVKGLVQIFLEFARAVAPSMAKIGQAISEVVIGLRDMFREAEKSGQLKKIFDAGAEAIKGFGEIIKGVIKILMEMADQGGLPAAEAMKKFGKALQDAAPLIGAFFANLARAAEVIATVVSWLAKLGPALSKIVNPIKALQDAFPKATKDMESFTKGFEKIGAVVPAAMKQIEKFVQTVQKGMDKIAQDTAKALAKAGQEVVKWTTKLVSDTKSGIDKTNAAIKQGFDKSVQVVKQAVDKMVQDAKAWWDKMVQEVSSGVDRAVAAVKALVDKSVEAIQELPGRFEQAGKDMVDGLIKGIASGAARLAKTLVEMVMAGVAAMKAALNMHSPSRLMADEVGLMIPAGIVQGIKAGTPALNAAMAASMRTLPMTANVALAGASRGSAIGLGSGTGKQVIEVKLDTGSGGDGALGTLIGGLARRGQLKITANAVVGGRK